MSHPESFANVLHPSIANFAAEVGPVGPVTCVGGRTQSSVGGVASTDAREVHAPAGIRSVVPEEMIVRVAAGTRLADLHEALRASGQRVSLPQPLDASATVGGALATSFGGVHQLSLGPPRDSVMEVTYVTADGEVAKSGGAVVKNVSGFDLCRLLVGSLGTLGFVAEVVLRATPIPAATTWLRGPTYTADIRSRLHAPGSIVATSEFTYILLEGHAADVDLGVNVLLDRGFETSEGPPPLYAHRWSVRRGDEFAAGCRSGSPFCALVGTGIVSSTKPGAAPHHSPGVRQINATIKTTFDPTGRMNPGREILSFPTSEPTR